jgi:hypothetical protein
MELSQALNGKARDVSSVFLTFSFDDFATAAAGTILVF